MKIVVAKHTRLNSSDLIKIRIDWEGKDVATWPDTKRKVQEWAQVNGYVLHAVEPMLGTGVRSAKKFKVQTQASDEELLQSYCKRNKLNEPLQKTGKHLLSLTSEK